MPPPTSILPTHEVMFLRGIKKTAVILLLLLRLDRPITAKEVSQRVLNNHSINKDIPIANRIKGIIIEFSPYAAQN